MKALLGNIYKNPMGDCTAFGLSSKHTELYLEFEGGREMELYADYLVLVEDRWGKKAIPKSLLESGKSPMFGGNFIYSSHSAFPSDAPIKIFDRVEG